MITIDNIKKSSTQEELNEMVEMALFERGCEASHDMTYAEQADFFIEESAKISNPTTSLLEVASILLAAEGRWAELA